MEKLDLSGLEAWPEDQAGKAHSLLKEYHDIFLLEKCDMGRLSTRLCEKKGFFKRFDFQKKRFLQQKKRFSVPNG